MKHLLKIRRPAGSSVETLIMFEDFDNTRTSCQRRNLGEMGNFCVEVNPLNCPYWKRGTGECGYKMTAQEYKEVPVELIKDLRKMR